MSTCAIPFRPALRMRGGAGVAVRVAAALRGQPPRLSVDVGLDRPPVAAALG